jgi:hypothetical protein
LYNPFNDTDPSTLSAAIVNYTLVNNTGSSTFGSGTANVSPGADGQIPTGTKITLGTTSNCCEAPFTGVLYYAISWTTSTGAFHATQNYPDYDFENYCEWAANLPVEGSPALPTFTLTLS